jgi:hypothetical protein
VSHAAVQETDDLGDSQPEASGGLHNYIKRNYSCKTTITTEMITNNDNRHDYYTASGQLQRTAKHKSNK